MFGELLSLLLSKILWIGLHIEGNSTFPKPLSSADEKKYFELFNNGDESARSILIEHNLRLVAHIVKKYYSSTNDQDDLISIGTIGLIKAVNTFSYDKGKKFSTYAARCVENEILMYFRSIKKTQGDVYINEPIDNDNDGNTITLLDLCSDEESLIDNIDLKMKSEKLYKLIDKYLDDREKQILYLRYGLNGCRPLTQREIAQKLNISRSYVSRIERKALIILRNHFDNKI